MCNSHMVTGQCEARGTTTFPTNQKRCNSHTATGFDNSHGTTTPWAVLGRQRSQTTTANQPEKMTALNSANRHGVATVDNNDTTRSNPIDQLAHPFERFAANKQTNTTSVIKPVTTQNNSPMRKK